MAKRNLSMTEEELKFYKRSLEEAVNACYEIDAYIGKDMPSKEQHDAVRKRIKVVSLLVAWRNEIADKLEKRR